MNIIVFAEHSDGVFKKSTLEALSYAKSINGSEKVTALVIGSIDENQLLNLGNYGADHILYADQNQYLQFDSSVYATLLASACQHSSAQVVVLSNSYSGKAIAPRVSVKLKAGLVSGVISLPEIQGNSMSVKKTVFSGKGISTVSINSEIKVLAITPNSYQLNSYQCTPSIEKFDTATQNSVQSIEIKRVTGKIPLTEAEIVVSGGRGWKGPENWGMIEELAQILGGATACSKPVSDMHWRTHDEHVGQTGITIKPNLYIATGISGAIQHLAGVSSSKVIVVINKDPEAPFFKAADYGIVGDIFEVMPQIIDAAKKYKMSSN